MKPDDNPPALVSEAPAISVDVLLSEARQFGRQTVESAVAAGEALIRAKELCFEANKGKRGLWEQKLRQYGFNPVTARRLMQKARNREAIKMIASLDMIYDDGQPQPENPGDPTPKLVCRDCRIRGRKYDPKCRACKALNRPVPQPKEDKPLVDEDGFLIPEVLVPVWQDAITIREWGRQLMAFAKSLAGLAERPGCSGIPAVELRKQLKAAFNTAWAFRPGFVCEACQGQGCEPCQGRGWLPNAIVRDRRARERAMLRKAQQQGGNEPIPE